MKASFFLSIFALIVFLCLFICIITSGYPFSLLKLSFCALTYCLSCFISLYMFSILWFKTNGSHFLIPFLMYSLLIAFSFLPSPFKLHYMCAWCVFYVDLPLFYGYHITFVEMNNFFAFFFKLGEVVVPFMCPIDSNSVM